MSISDTLLEPMIESQIAESAITENLLEPSKGRVSFNEVMSVRVCGRLYSFSIFSTQEISWLVPFAEQIQQLILLEKNWDSYGALPLNPVVIQPALQILSRYLDSDLQPPNIMLTPSGGIQMEWSNSAKLLDIEIEPNMNISSFFSNRETGHEIEIEKIGKLEELAESFESISQN